jgi:hypothetical protein
MTNGAIWIAPFGKDFAGEMGFFYSFNVRVQGRCAASSRSVPWNEVLDLSFCVDVLV